MYNKKIRNLLKKPQPNSGFTLTELLTGLIMSIFVTGALGFGLYQIMSATGAERAKANARTEASRAVEFISDELRRAQSIQVDNSITSLNASTVAPNYNLPSGGTARLALNIPGVDQSIIYSVAPPPSGSPWKGPLVIYRWGPNLGNDGDYTNATNPTAWSNEALIDQVDNTAQSMNCGGTSVSYEGFFACIIDDDGDGVVEDGTVDTNGDGKVDNNDSDEDVDGLSATAEIFLTGGIDADVIAGNDSNYTANTKAVARAKDVTVNSAQTKAVAPISFRSLEADYICDPNTSSLWTMRTDFDNTTYDSASERPDRNEATKWIHEPGRQAQPIDIDSSNDLILNSIPIGATSCLSKGNQGADVSQPLSNFVDDDGVSSQPNTHSVDHIIKFKKEVPNRPGGNDDYYYKTFNGNTASGYDNPNVKGDGTVQVFKNGSKIELNAPIDTSSNVAPARGYSGYKKSNDVNEQARPTLGDFLIAKGFAKYTNGVDNTAGYTIENLKPDERIIAFEVGQDDSGYTENANDNEKPDPGFDLQDNVFIMRHDAFGETHPKTSSNTENN